MDIHFDFILIIIRACELTEDGEECRNDSLGAEEYDVGQRETDGSLVESIGLECADELDYANSFNIAQDPVKGENFVDSTSEMNDGDDHLDDNEYVSFLEIEPDDKANDSSEYGVDHRETDGTVVGSIDPVGGENVGDSTSKMNDGDDHLDDTEFVSILEIERDDEANDSEYGVDQLDTDGPVVGSIDPVGGGKVGERDDGANDSSASDAVKAELFDDDPIDGEPFNVALLRESLGNISSASDCVITAEYEVEYDWTKQTS